MLSQLSVVNSYYAMSRFEGDGKEGMEVNIANTHLVLKTGGGIEPGVWGRAFSFSFCIGTKMVEKRWYQLLRHRQI